MQLSALDAGISGLYSPLILDYLNRNEKLRPFINEWPTTEGFRNQIALQKNRTLDRSLLYHRLKAQYAGLKLGKAVENNLDLLLKPSTYTITTGQQIHIFLGPMYVYWKIVSTLALCNKLKQENPESDFVPVFWMATEDHDFAEVNHLEIFNRSIVWEGNGEAAIPVGRRKPAGLPGLLDELDSLFERDPLWKTYSGIFREAYSVSGTFAEATRRVLHAIFGEHGLVIIDPDDGELKRDFLPFIQSELKDGWNFNLVNEQSERLKEYYETQVNPRPINLFYTGRNGRERIERNGNELRTVSGELLCDKKDLEAWSLKNIDAISANVVLRPLYQECILPNLAYIGGPGELAYWMQLKGVFDNAEIPFPILENRKSIFILGSKIIRQIEKLNLDIADLFLDTRDLGHKMLERSNDGLISLNAELEELLVLKDRIIGKAAGRIPSKAKPLADFFNSGEKLIRNIDKEIFNLQKEVMEKDLERLLKTKSMLKDKSFTQERNTYLIQFLTSLDTNSIVDGISEKYWDMGPVALLLADN